MKFAKRYTLMNQEDGQTSTGSAAPDTQTDSGANPTAPASEAPAADGTLLGGGAAPTGEQAEKPALPETYTFKLPEGVKFDEGVEGDLSGLAKELGLSQDSAQKVADLGAKMSQKWAADQVQALENAGNEWAASTQGDAEIGGDKLAASLAAGQRALKELGTPELSKLLTTSRLGNHPEVVRFFARVGQRVSQDGFVGGNGAPGKTPDARSLYANSGMNP